MSEAGNGPPDISIVVTIVDGGDVLRKCLEALATQSGSQQMEVIVPYDQVSRETAAMAADFPEFVFLDLGVIADGMVPRNALDLHHFWDIRRAEGIKRARGRLIGLVHDRGVPAQDWAVSMLELHRNFSAAAIGGCADNGYDTSWHWAVHFFDFGRYMAPLQTAESDFLSVTNICYDGSALRELKHLYEHRFRELLVHESFLASGKKLVLSDRPRTTELRPRVPTTELALEWFHWGRKYAGIRSGEITATQRSLRILVTPLVPFVLFFRQLGVQRRKRIYLRRFWSASPLVLLIVSMWALGELIGYCRGPEPEVE